MEKTLLELLYERYALEAWYVFKATAKREPKGRCLGHHLMI